MKDALCHCRSVKLQQFRRFCAKYSRTIRLCQGRGQRQCSLFPRCGFIVVAAKLDAAPSNCWRLSVSSITQHREPFLAVTLLCLHEKDGIMNIEKAFEMGVLCEDGDERTD